MAGESAVGEHRYALRLEIARVTDNDGDLERPGDTGDDRRTMPGPTG